MSQASNSLISGLSALSIVPPKSKDKGKTGMDILETLCFLHLISEALKSFDSTAPVDDTVDDNGKIRINPFLPPIDDEDLAPSDVVELDEECEEIISAVHTKIDQLVAVAETMMAIVIAFSKIMIKVAKSGNYDLDIVTQFFEEFVILLGSILTFVQANGLPESWKSFHDLAKTQREIFGRYTMEEDYDIAHDLIWMLSNNTDIQIKFLQTCINESVGFENVMLEVGPAIKSMLSLQEEFILKLIKRLKESKAVQVSTFQKAIQC